MIREQALDRPPGPMRSDYGAVGAVAVLAYFVVFGDLAWRDIPAARVASAALAATIVLVYVGGLGSRADRFSRNILIALLLFMVAGVASRFPRQALDSMLTALLFVAALSLGRRVLARASARRLFVVGLMALSAVLTITISAQLIVPFFEWWALTDWQVFPPLDMRIQPDPWVSRYELSLLLLMLYPSWWIGRITRFRAICGVIVGILIVAACLIAGSRTVWFAAGGGVVAILLPVIRQGFGWDMRRMAILGAALCILIATLLVSGLGAALTERVVRLAPIAERGATWGPLLELWVDRPLVGYGPGSFPWLLRLTDYFDTNSFSPRTPDSAVIQLVVETGLIGLVAAFIVLATVVPAVFRGRSRAARFALVVGLLAAVSLTPTEFASIVAVGIAWVAFAAPHESPEGSPKPSRHLLRVRAASLATLSIVGLAFGATMVADAAYTSARGAIVAGDFSGAKSSLEIATSLDPGLAIYRRQLGALHLVSGEPAEAVAALERATRINPTDDLAWRILGLARAESGDTTGSMAAVERAIDLQRADPTNLLLISLLLRDEGEQAEARRVLSEVVQGWPMIVAAPGWAEFAAPFSTSQLLEMAHDRWAQGLSSPEPLVSQPLLLGVMIDVADTELHDESARLSATMKRAYIAVMRCDPDAGSTLVDASDADRRTPTYWALAIRLAHVDGRSARDFQRLYRLMTSDLLLTDREVRATLNPLQVNGIRGANADLWGYRRQPIDWPDMRWDLPSPFAGFARWHRAPVAALQETGLADVLADCQTA